MWSGMEPAAARQTDKMSRMHADYERTKEVFLSSFTKDKNSRVTENYEETSGAVCVMSVRHALAIGPSPNGLATERKREREREREHVNFLGLTAALQSNFHPRPRTDDARRAHRKSGGGKVCDRPSSLPSSLSPASLPQVVPEL